MKNPGIFARAAKVLSQIERNELKATFVSMAAAFILLGSYYVLRAPRDSLASEWSNSEVAFLWNLNFFVSAALVSLFGLAICKFRLKQVIAGVYLIFAASFVFLMFGVSTEEAGDPGMAAAEPPAATQVGAPAAGGDAPGPGDPGPVGTARSASDGEADAASAEEAESRKDSNEEALESARSVLFDKAFYLWVSVFALFNTSTFWLFMTDMFSKEQSTRLFAVIAAGASAGTLIGPPIPTLFGGILGQHGLILIASIGLLLVVPLIFYLYHLKGAELDNANVAADRPAIGGKWWQGFRSFATSPFMLGIAGFILLYVFIGSFVYFEQKNLLADFSRAERTQILGGIDWIVNILTFGLALFVTGRIVRRLGMPAALALMPVLVCLGMLVLAFAPIITVLLALQVFRRGGNYGLTRPAREMLFTSIADEDRFKSKPVIDIVVYRGGDAAAGSLFAILTDKIGLGIAAMAAIGAGIAALWGWVGVKLGRRFDSSEAPNEAARRPGR